MAGIGEASAVLAFVQLGFSIATTINTYIGDVKDAPSEACDLANEINSTLFQIEVLNDLIAKNDPANGWSQKGVVFAQKCLQESEGVIKKISKLLLKAGTNAASESLVTLKTIDVSVFNKIKWPLFKPQLEKLKRKLECVRMDVCLLVGMHRAISGSTKEERDSAGDVVVQFAKSRATAKKVLRRINTIQKENIDESDLSPASAPTREPRNVHFSVPSRRKKRRASTPGSFKVDLGPDMEPLTIAGDSPEDVQIQFASLTSAIRDMINEEIQAEETAKKKAAEERELHDNQVLEEYKRTLVDKYAELERKAATLRDQLKVGFEPELPSDQIDSHVRRMQAEELSSDEILKRINQMGFRHPATNESDQFTVVSNTSRPDNSRIWTQLKRGVRESDINSVPMALRQNQSIPGMAKVTSISLSYDRDGDEWHVVQVNVSLPWLVKQLADEEKKDSKGIGKINETLRAYSKLPQECRWAAQRWLDATGNTKYAWALLYAHTSKAKVSRSRKFLQKALLGAAIETPADNVLLVYRATRDSHGRSNDERKLDSEERVDTVMNDSTTAVNGDDDSVIIKRSDGAVVVLPGSKSKTKAESDTGDDPIIRTRERRPSRQDLHTSLPVRKAYSRAQNYSSRYDDDSTPYATRDDPSYASRSAGRSYNRERSPDERDYRAPRYERERRSSPRHGRSPSIDREFELDRRWEKELLDGSRSYYGGRSSPSRPRQRREYNTSPTGSDVLEETIYRDMGDYTEIEVSRPRRSERRTRDGYSSDERQQSSLSRVRARPRSSVTKYETYSRSRARSSSSSRERARPSLFRSAASAATRRTSTEYPIIIRERSRSRDRSRWQDRSRLYDDDDYTAVERARPDARVARNSVKIVERPVYSDEDRKLDRRLARERRDRSVERRGFGTRSDSGYSTQTISIRDDAVPQPPNWILSRARSAMNKDKDLPDSSDDSSSNTSVEVQTGTNEIELRDRLLSMYTNSQVGGSGAGPAAATENGDEAAKEDRVEPKVNGTANGLDGNSSVEGAAKEDEGEADEGNQASDGDRSREDEDEIEEIRREFRE